MNSAINVKRNIRENSLVGGSLNVESESTKVNVVFPFVVEYAGGIAMSLTQEEAEVLMRKQRRGE